MHKTLAAVGLLELASSMAPTGHIRHYFPYLLPRHFIEHHDIGFYASELCITTTYLSRIVRQVSGEKSYGFKNFNFALSGSSKALQLFKYDKRSSNERPYSVWPKWCIFSITLM